MFSLLWPQSMSKAASFLLIFCMCRVSKGWAKTWRNFHPKKLLLKSCIFWVSSCNPFNNKAPIDMGEKNQEMIHQNKIRCRTKNIWLSQLVWVFLCFPWLNILCGCKHKCSITLLPECTYSNKGNRSPPMRCPPTAFNTITLSKKKCCWWKGSAFFSFMEISLGKQQHFWH